MKRKRQERKLSLDELGDEVETKTYIEGIHVYVELKWSSHLGRYS